MTVSDALKYPRNLQSDVVYSVETTLKYAEDAY